MLRNVGLVVVDEAHHATAKSYLDILPHFGCFEDDGAVAWGFTATMTRGDDMALGSVWQDVVYARDIASMMHDGWLCRARGKRIYVSDLDLRDVRVSGGDYSDSGLGQAMKNSLAPEAVAKAYTEHATERPGIIFSPTVAVAGLMQEAMREAGAMRPSTGPRSRGAWSACS